MYSEIKTIRKRIQKRVCFFYILKGGDAKWQ